MADGAFSMGLIDPKQILAQVYQQQQARQPGAFSAPGVEAQMDYNAIAEYVDNLARRREDIPQRQAAGSLPSVEGGFEAPRYAFGTVFKDPAQREYEAAAAEIGARYKQEGKQYGPEYYQDLSNRMLETGNTKGAWMAAQQAGILRAAQKPATKDFAYKSGELKEIDVMLPDGKVGSQTFQFWPELAASGYQYAPDLPVGFIPAERTAVPRKEAMSINLSVGDKAQAELAAKKYGEAVDKAEAASKSNASLAYAQDMLKGIETGSLTNIKVAAGKLASSMGVKMPEISNLEAAGAALQNITLQRAEAMKGALSDKDVTFLRESGPQITNTPRGRQTMIAILSSLNDREMERERMMANYISENPDRTLFKKGGKSFSSVWTEYVNNNSIVDKAKSMLPPPVPPRDKIRQQYRDSNGNIRYNMGRGKWETAEEASSGW